MKNGFSNWSLKKNAYSDMTRIPLVRLFSAKTIIQIVILVPNGYLQFDIDFFIRLLHCRNIR